MGESIKKAIIFLAGLGIGAGVTYKLLDAKYKQIANDEIESMREYFMGKSDKTEENVTIAETVTEKHEKPDLSDYVSKIEDAGYMKYSDISEPDKKKEEEKKEDDDEQDAREKPYIIEPDMYGLFSEYDTVNLTYFSDGYVVEDIYDQEFTNDEVEKILGWENLHHMGMYEEDVLHIRNDKTRTDYEICSVLEKYKEE